MPLREEEIRYLPGEKVNVCESSMIVCASTILYACVCACENKNTHFLRQKRIRAGMSKQGTSEKVEVGGCEEGGQR